MRHRRRLSVLTPLFFCIGFWFSHCPNVAAQTSSPLELSYVGLDTIHVAYDYSPRCPACSVKLEVFQDESLILAVELNQLSGKYHHIDLTQGTYKYQIAEYLGDSVENLFVSRSAHIDGTSIGGTLLFDESISQAFSCQPDLDVPADISLNLINADSSGDCRIKADGTLTINGVLWKGSYLKLSGAGTVSLLGSNFTQNLILDLGAGIDLDASHSMFRGSLGIEGSSQSLRFTENHFIDGVSLFDRMPAVFIRNVFLGPLDFFTMSGTQTWCGPGVFPNVSDNSFLGRRALTASGRAACTGQTLIDVGSNYYGDFAGPRFILPFESQPLADVDYRNKWLQRGAGVLAPPFNAGNITFQKTGVSLNNTSINPRVWLHNWRIGQHVLGATAKELVRGKEILYSVDLVTSHQEVSGAKLWVLWNGEPVESTAGPTPILRRDHGQLGVLYRTARTSVDFILPAVDAGDSVALELWLDTRELDDYRGGELRKLQTLEVALKAPPGPVGIRLVPISVNGTRPSLSSTRRSVASLLPAMLPVTHNNLRISATSYSPGFSDRFIPTSIFLNVVATELLLYRLALEYDPDDYPKGELMDFVIGVMPEGSLGGADGVYMNLRRGVILVDESRPDAFLHEMGHAIGLYNLREQYKWPYYPPIGRPVEGYTLFLNQETVASSQISPLFQSPSGRVMHIPRDDNWWHDPYNLVIDVLGNQGRFWAHPDTLKSFEDYFYHLGSTRPLPPTTIQMTRSADALRQVTVSMDTERVERVEGTLAGERPCVTYQPVSGTIRLFSRADTEAAASPQASAPTLISDAALPLCLDDTGSPFMDPAGDVRICVIPVDPFMPQLEQCRRVLAPERVHTSRQQDLALFNFDVPESTRAFSIVTQRSPIDPLVIRATQSMTVQLLEPITGTSLGDTVTLRWQGSSVARDPDFPSEQPLLYQVSVSVNDGTTWQALGLPTAAQQMTIDTQALPAGNSIAFRVSATDGFEFVHAQARGLRLAPRLPEVVIMAPREGDQSGIDQRWVLSAWAWDVEANTNLLGTWQSSRDGVLGEGPLLTDIVLSAGLHELSYRVVDALGTPSQANIGVQVEIDPLPTLSLTADALDITMPWRDPVVPGPLLMAIDSPQIATLTVRNTGAATNARLRLSWQSPDGTEELLVEEDFSIEPFEVRALGARISALQSGTYRFRGELLTFTDEGAVAKTDQRDWTIESIRPAELSPETLHLEFGNPSAEPVFQRLLLSNTGSHGLIVQNLSLEMDEQDPEPFQIWVDKCSGVGLAPGENCEVVIRFSSAVGSAFTADLWVSATDEEAPKRIHLSGWTGTDPGSIFHDRFERQIEGP